MNGDKLVQMEESINRFCLKDFTSKLKAYGSKKLGIQKLGDLLTITIEDISMRGGWSLKTLNTFFGYWVGFFTI